MLEQLDASDLIATLPCAIQMPENWTNYFGRTGPLPPVANDHRRHPRFYLRAPAKLTYHSTFETLLREPGDHLIYLKDISRVSVAFLHSEQLYPNERMELQMLDGTRWAITVVRCLKRRDFCYEIAAAYVDAE